MKAPFPWFGGKSLVAGEVWAAFGDVDNYVEPFAGSLAVLLDRPAEHDGPRTGAETVNDLDAYVANFWRALAAAPEEVARYADWPVNETDLIARHRWLVDQGSDRVSRMKADPDFFDAKVAGWWVWGLCAWIGGGWCATVHRKRPYLGAGRGVNRKLPHLGNAGRGVHRKLPHLGDAGRGVHRNLPHLGDGRGVHRNRLHLGNAGQGVNRNLPHLGDAGEGVNRDLPHLGDAGEGVHMRREDLVAYMTELAARLRRVRVCCGDWSRVVTDAVLSYGATVGVLLDPPYDEDIRSRELYAQDGGHISADVRAWAVEAGRDRRLRIALCGYEGEHDMPGDWRAHAWSSRGGYSKSGGAGAANRHLERIWFSPGCLSPRQQELFA